MSREYRQYGLRSGVDSMTGTRAGGVWYADAELLAQLDAAGQIALRYADGSNPNGAVDDVAGVTNEAGNVLGLMPHPEHAVDPLLGSVDGALIMGSLVDAARLSITATV